MKYTLIQMYEKKCIQTHLLLGPRLRVIVRGQQRGLAWIASIYQQVAIKLSCNYRGHI